MPDVTMREQRSVLRALAGALPPHCTLLLLGSTAAMDLGIRDLTTTKDVDVCIVALAEDGTRVAPPEIIERVLAALQVAPAQAPAEDGSWVKALVPVGGATFQVDFIRGKSRDRPRGTFIERGLLDRIIQAATPRGGLLVPTPTDLMVMKAWAAVDQERLAEANPLEADLHRARASKYRQDTRIVAEAALRSGALDRDRVVQLLTAMAPHRRTPVEAVLSQAGAL